MLSVLWTLARACPHDAAAGDKKRRTKNVEGTLRKARECLEVHGTRHGLGIARWCSNGLAETMIADSLLDPA